MNHEGKKQARGTDLEKLDHDSQQRSASLKRVRRVIERWMSVQVKHRDRCGRKKCQCGDERSVIRGVNVEIKMLLSTIDHLVSKLNSLQRGMFLQPEGEEVKARWQGGSRTPKRSPEQQTRADE